MSLVWLLILAPKGLVLAPRWPLFEEVFRGCKSGNWMQHKQLKVSPLNECYFRNSY